jgi:hypothetical protein
VTADSDASRMVTAAADANSAAIAGPFVLTDFIGGSVTMTIVPGTDCTQPGMTVAHTLNGINYEIHGMRILVPAGFTLCTGNSSVVFSGFRPY